MLPEAPASLAPVPASMVPPIRTSLLPPGARLASSTISPLRVDSERAWITPVWLTTSWRASTFAAAISTTRPPSAATLPLFANCATAVGSAACRSASLNLVWPSAGMLKVVRPSPSKSRFSVTLLADTRPTEPRATLISPSLRTTPPSSATVPPGEVVVIDAPPSTFTWAMLPSGPKKSSCSFLPMALSSEPAGMKLLLAMSSVDATSPPTFTDAPLPKTMPLGLMRNTLPPGRFGLPASVVRSAPSMREAWMLMPSPTTRFSSTAEVLGCEMLTRPPAPIEKLCQLTMPRCSGCTMFIVPTPCVIVTPPAMGVKPEGNTWAMAGAAPAPTPAQTSDSASGRN